MKEWYQNRMETGVTHRGQKIPQNKLLYLTSAQVKLHNSGQEKVAKLDKPPTEPNEAGLMADWQEFENTESKQEKNKYPGVKHPKSADTK